MQTVIELSPFTRNWTGSGHGKRGGARVIFYSAEGDYVYLMTIYAKNQRADISAKELRVIKELIQ